MTAGQPYYSTKTMHGLPSVAEEVVQVNVQNNWDALAEIAIASYPESCPQLDHLALLLESHGIIVHRVSAPRPPHTYLHSATRSSLFIPDPYACPTRFNGAANGTAREKNHANARPLSLFPQSAALVYGTKVIEVPSTSSVPPFSSDDSSLSSASQSDQGATPEHGNNALFNLLENARIEVIRWPVTSPSSAHSNASEKKLVDIEEVSDTTDAEDEGPRFSPSDILVLSPTLLITRLSSCTNNKGLEYLWSVLSQSTKSLDPSPRINHQHGRTPAMQQVPPNPPRTTTTLLVRVTEPDAPTTNTSTMPGAYSPRASINSINQLIPKKGPTSYTPLCRALVPIDGRVMLYDPALVADGEARRLKSVLDRVQEGSRGSGGGSGGGSGELRELFAKSSKRDSTISYGTFGNDVDCSDDEGWQFISVEGLHLASILVVSPSLALLSPAPSTPAASSNSSSPNEDVLTKVSQVLGSLGIRTVSLPFSELNEKGGGVRDAVMVLRRESFAETSDDGYAEREQQNVWDQATPGEEATEGCFEAITASISTFFCGLFANFTSSTSESESESDVFR